MSSELHTERTIRNTGHRSSSSGEEDAYHSAPEDPGPMTSCPDPESECPDNVAAGGREGVAGRDKEDGDFARLRLDDPGVSDNQEGGGARGGVASEASGGVASEERVELSEEQVKELKERAAAAKQKGNDHFKNGDYGSAIDCYSEALELYPKSHDLDEWSCDHERAVCYANRAACHMKKESHQDVIDDCSEALTLEPDYLKALLRRAGSCEALEKYEEALEDYKKVLELDPNQIAARQGMVYLPDKVKEQREKLKDEMLGKLKELGNAILNPFGLSTDNFQMQQDPNSGGYSVNFKR